MYIVEWYDQDKNLHEEKFENQSNAWARANQLEKEYGCSVGVTFETEVD